MAFSVSSHRKADLERATSQDEKAAGLLGPTKHWIVSYLFSEKP